MNRKTTQVLLVEDDGDAIALIQANLAALSERTFHVEVCGSVADVERILMDAVFDIVLLDLNLPDSRGVDTVLGVAPLARNVPIVVLTGSNDADVGPNCIAAGAQDFLPKAELGSGRLARMIDFAMVRHDRVAEVERVALTDELTGLLNRRAVLNELDVAIARARRNLGAFALVMIDLDGFKQVNDRYGHAAGDEVLVEVAQRLADLCRTNDHSGRLGGDEFVLLLDGVASEDQAEVAVGRYLASVRRPIFVRSADGPRRANVSASFGIALCPAHGSTRQTLTEVADQAMYEVKRQNKDGLKVGARLPRPEPVPPTPARPSPEQTEALLAPLRAEFIARLEERIEAFSACLRAFDTGAVSDDLWTTTRRHAHSLAGIATVFGYGPLGQRAAELERAMEGDPDIGNSGVREQMALLVADCRQAGEAAAP